MLLKQLSVVFCYDCLSKLRPKNKTYAYLTVSPSPSLQKNPTKKHKNNMGFHVYITEHFIKVVTPVIKLDSDCRPKWYIMTLILQKGKEDGGRKVICAISH